MSRPEASSPDEQDDGGAPPPLTPPSGAPEVLVVEGILDGRVGDAGELRAAVAELSTSGAGAFRVDVTGGRFSMLPVETEVPPGAFDEAAQSAFLERLQRVVKAALPDSIETNLRCKLVYPDQVAETLFVVKGAEIEPLTRHRPRTPQDGGASPAAGDAGAPLGLRRRELLWMAPILLLVGMLVAWQTGWIDRVLAARAEQLSLDNGPFADLLQVDVTRSWGNYVVELRRGEDYPTTPAELAALRDASEDLTERAACELVGNGGDMFVQIVRDDGEALAERRIELRLLVVEADGVATAKLPGLMAAHGIRLSLSSAKKPK